MSTQVAFTPSTLAAFTFQPTLNGQQYNATVPFNFFGTTYYLQLSDLQNNLILYREIVSSGPVLQATLAWANNTATATTNVNHNVPVGTLANVLISETDTVYDGFFQALSTGPTTMTYTLNTDPNQSLSCQLEFPLNLVQGYLSNCYLFYYDATQSFEYSG